MLLTVGSSRNSWTLAYFSPESAAVLDALDSLDVSALLAAEVASEEASLLSTLLLAADEAELLPVDWELLPQAARDSTIAKAITQANRRKRFFFILKISPFYIWY